MEEIFSKLWYAVWCAGSQGNEIRHFRDIAIMPRPSAKVQQAKSQHASGKRGFDSGWTDDPFDALIDPDFEPTLSENGADSDDELSTRDFAFSITEGVEDEDSGAEVDEADDEWSEDGNGDDVEEATATLISIEHAKVKQGIESGDPYSHSTRTAIQKATAPRCTGNLFWCWEIHGGKEEEGIARGGERLCQNRQLFFTYASEGCDGGGVSRAYSTS